MKFRKKPVVIEAVRYDGANAAEIAKWQYRHIQSVGHPSRWFFEREDFDRIPGLGYEQRDSADAVVYDYLHRTWVGVTAGQWILRGTEGEFYPHEHEAFLRNYEPVE